VPVVRFGLGVQLEFQEDGLEPFLEFLGKIIKEYKTTLINATIRIVKKDNVSILPYNANGNIFAIVICFYQKLTSLEIKRTMLWMNKVINYLIELKGCFYQAYMPFPTRIQFESCYDTRKLQLLKKKYDPNHVFENVYTRKYYTHGN
jgi:hypothetical protein